MDTDTFWKSEGLKHIIPANRGEFPEGFDVLSYLKELVEDRSIVEIGCGYGRLAKGFSVEQYIGYDINLNAIKKAKELNPLYNFKELYEDTEICKSDIVMIYTVALHISDENINSFLQRMSKNTSNVLIAEIMDRKWRRPGDPPVFNRFDTDYDSIMASLGFEIINKEKKKYKRYKDENIHFIEYKKLNNK